MRRLLFTVPGMMAIVAISGCGTPTGALKSADGKELTTASGAPIVVVDTPSGNTVPKLSENASYKERIAHEKAVKAQPVEITRSEAEMALEVRDAALKEVCTQIQKLIGANDIVAFRKLVIFIDGRPQVSEEALRKVVEALPAKENEGKRNVTAGGIAALRAVIEQELQENLEKDVYPKIVKSTLDSLEPRVRDLVAKGKFAVAREHIWNASTRGIPQVDAPVRVRAYELMHGLVNPSNWRELEPKIDKIFKEALASKQYNDGIKKLKDFEVSAIVREYSAFIDKKLEAIRAELKVLGVPEKAMAPILDKQTGIIAAAAKIADVRDEIITVEDAKKENREIAARKDPALAEYYKRLDDFHDTLVKHNCTTENADKIVSDLDENLLALITLLRKPALFETDGKDAITALQLGTKSLNNRVHNLVKDDIEKLIKARDAAKRAAYLAKLKAAMDELERKVRELVAASKFEEARELIWNASITGDIEWDTEMFSCGLALLRDLVNPEDWKRIEADITGTFAKLSGKGDFVALRKFLENYPLIRQHTVKLDEQLAKVRAEAEALGASPKEAEKIARFVCENMVTESEKLVDHLDKLTSNASKAGMEVDKSKLQKELDIYAIKLAAYHATPENVERIVAKLRVELDKLIAKPTNPVTTHLALGTNAVNDRIKALIAKLLASIEKTKYEWENKEHARVMTDLEKRVRAAVKEKRFSDARDYIRDEKLIGRKDLDLSLYGLRVGLLDSCVNPAQQDFLLAEIDQKIAELMADKNYEGVISYIEEYPYVHDQYVKIEAALAAVKTAMVALEISEKESSYDEKVRFFSAIQEILEKRRESWKPERDLSGVEKALSEVAKALFDHLNKHPELIESNHRDEYQHILADIAKLDRTITTWELNENLRSHMYKEVLGRLGYTLSYYDEAKRQLAIQNYEKLLSAIDEEVSFDSQIAMAEEAISRQLGVKCEKATFKVNALLGEYARVFRLIKKGIKVDKDQATTMLLGGAYLDQPQVVKRALELGADVNGVSSRDPRGRSALALAVDTGHSGLVETLVKAGASLSAVDADGNAVIHYAAKSGNLSVLKAIVAGAPVNVKNNCGNTPLAIAVVRNQPAVVDFLVASVPAQELSAFVDSKNKKDETAFDIAATFGSRDVLDSLAKAGATYSTKDLILAEKSDHVAIAQWLINQGLDVNAEGVMAAACPATRTGRYLVAEGGVAVGHACEACDAGMKKAAEAKIIAAAKSAEGKAAKPCCKPQPVDVLLVPQCKQ